jgi:hypothetical protein
MQTYLASRTLLPLQEEAQCCVGCRLTKAPSRYKRCTSIYETLQAFIFLLLMWMRTIHYSLYGQFKVPWQTNATRFSVLLQTKGLCISLSPVLHFYTFICLPLTFALSVLLCLIGYRITAIFHRLYSVSLLTLTEHKTLVEK